MIGDFKHVISLLRRNGFREAEGRLLELCPDPGKLWQGSARSDVEGCQRLPRCEECNSH